MQMLEEPLASCTGKEVLQELLALLPELFDENAKAITLIGSSLGGLLATNQLSPTEVCIVAFFVSLMLVRMMKQSGHLASNLVSVCGRCCHRHAE